jgi:type II secretory pathway pseudopilin PulG
MKHSNLKAFTLIELIIYVAIASMVLVASVRIGWNILQAQEKQEAQQEVLYNSRMALHHMQYYIRQAETVTTASSTFASHPGILTLDYAGEGTDVVIDTYTKSVTIGGQSTTIRKLRIKDGAASAVDITSDLIDVTDFTLTNLQRGTEPFNIHIALTLERENPGGVPQNDASESFETSLSLRER